MTQLDDELAAIKVAPDALSRNQALNVWLTDATAVVNQLNDRATALSDMLDTLVAKIGNASDRLDTLNDEAERAKDAVRMLQRLEARMLTRGIVWNPRRLAELREEGIT
jgi:archaellum component FlaC